MSHRIGECSQCGAVFKLPASFAHDQARCTKCGGVVQIAPAQGGGAPPVPARKVLPKPPAAATPVAAGRSGPSAKEEILARRKAESPAGAPPPRPQGAAPPARGQATAPVRPAAAAPVRPAAAAPARPAAAPAAPRAGSGRTAASRTAHPEAPAPKAEAAEAGAARGRRARPAARGSRSRQGEDQEPNYRDRVQAQRKKNSLLYGAIALVLLVALGVGGFFVLKKAEEDHQRSEQAKLAQSGVKSPTPPSDEAAEGQPADATREAPDLPTAPKPVREPASETAAEKPAPPAAAPKTPESVDLSAIPDLGPLPETDESRWDEIRQLVADAFDLDAGASAARAADRLVALGKPAFPAILNALKRVDVSTDTGHRVGDLMQKTLERICNGNNFGWKYPGQDNHVYFNKRVIQRWCEKWLEVKDNEAAWLKLTKQTGAKPETEEEAPASKELDGSDFDFDD